jgi:hypothetical protein
MRAAGRGEPGWPGRAGPGAAAGSMAMTARPRAARSWPVVWPPAFGKIRSSIVRAS